MTSRPTRPVPRFPVGKLPVDASPARSATVIGSSLDDPSRDLAFSDGHVPNRTPRRIAGLDGLRALAVAGVVVYHAFPQLLPGGFIGVDVFFVLSGFLITGNLLDLLDNGQRHKGDLREGLRYFLSRRVRRILPPLVPLLVVVGLLIWALGRGLASGLTDGYTRQVLGALTFSSNWVAVASSQSYFLATAPAVLKNMWSLAVEEQFYLLWPLVVVLLLKLSRRWQTVIVLTAALASAVAMALLAIPGEDPSRSYYGTDTHVFGLLLGAGVALAMRRSGTNTAEQVASRGEGDTPPRDRTVSGRAALVVVSLVLLGVCARSFNDQSLWTYRGGLLVVTLLTCLIVAALARGAGRLGDTLDAGILGAVGRRSYGIYLWHWPLLVIATQMTPVGWRGYFSGHVIALVAVFAGLGCAWLSYRFIERPLLRRAPGQRHLSSNDLRPGAEDEAIRPPVRARQGRTGSTSSSRSATRVLSTCLLAIGASTFLATSGPSAAGIAEQQINRGEAAVAAHQQQPRPSETSRDQPRGVSSPGDSPGPIAITALGDSVMLASAPEIFTALPAATVDAEVSRQPWDAPAMLRALAARDQLQPVVVIGLGTNGTYSSEVLDAIRATVGQRELVLVTSHADRPWVARNNQLLSTYAAQHPAITIADWNRAISVHPSLLGPDGVHPTAAGGELYAQVIADAVSTAKTAGQHP